MSVLLELVICVNNSRGSHVLLYLAARFTTVSLDIVLMQSYLPVKIDSNSLLILNVDHVTIHVIEFKSDKIKSGEVEGLHV